MGPGNMIKAKYNVFFGNVSIHIYFFKRVKEFYFFFFFNIPIDR